MFIYDLPPFSGILSEEETTSQLSLRLVRDLIRLQPSFSPTHIATIGPFSISATNSKLPPNNQMIDDNDGTPNKHNHRYHAKKTMDATKEHDPWVSARVFSFSTIQFLSSRFLNLFFPAFARSVRIRTGVHHLWSRRTTLWMARWRFPRSSRSLLLWSW